MTSDRDYVQETLQREFDSTERMLADIQEQLGELRAQVETLETREGNFLRQRRALQRALGGR